MNDISYDELARNYQDLQIAILIRAMQDYAKTTCTSTLKDRNTAKIYLEKLGQVNYAGIDMTGKDIIKYLDEHPDILKGPLLYKLKKEDNDGMA